ncbi:MAG: hypothetical protein ACRDS0_39475 [Pseudonocardiaceae bacterium]
MVHPMMMAAGMWDVTPEEGAVGILHAARVDPWAISLAQAQQLSNPFIAINQLPSSSN